MVKVRFGSTIMPPSVQVAHKLGASTPLHPQYAERLNTDSTTPTTAQAAASCDASSRSTELQLDDPKEKIGSVLSGRPSVDPDGHMVGQSCRCRSATFVPSRMSS